MLFYTMGLEVPQTVKGFEAVLAHHPLPVPAVHAVHVDPQVQLADKGLFAGGTRVDVVVHLVKVCRRRRRRRRCCHGRRGGGRCCRSFCCDVVARKKALDLAVVGFAALVLEPDPHLLLGQVHQLADQGTLLLVGVRVLVEPLLQQLGLGLLEPVPLFASTSVLVLGSFLRRTAAGAGAGTSAATASSTRREESLENVVVVLLVVSPLRQSGMAER